MTRAVVAVAGGRGRVEIEFTRKQIEAHLGNRAWRLDNLYLVQDKDGKRVQFRPNWAQAIVRDRVWYRNIILKARQLGMTTGAMIDTLDQALFVPNTKSGVIAHGLDEATDLFDKKIKFAYDTLPPWLKKHKRLTKCTGKQISFSNDSDIRVGTSMRSGTLQNLHVSEFGKICAKYPDRAEEIISGSLPAVPKNGVITFESTAEGREGYFFEYCQASLAKARTGGRLTQMDWRFFFFPWWREKDYSLSDEDTSIVIVPDRLLEYFDSLEDEIGCEISQQQRAWYATTERDQGDKMKREYPSTPDEAFAQSIEGAYFAKQFKDVYLENRIGEFPYQKSLPVATFWDIGFNDSTTIWFVQRVGGWENVVDYYENAGEALQHYLKILRDKGYTYSAHFGPHDLDVHEFTGKGKTRRQVAQEHGFNFTVVPRCESKLDAIQSARDVFPICRFDSAKCEAGLKKLERYRKAWDQSKGCWKDYPLHDDASHTADAFMTFAQGREMVYGRVSAKRIQTVRSGRTM